jgi:hypothetical protein
MERFGTQQSLAYLMQYGTRQVPKTRDRGQACYCDWSRNFDRILEVSPDVYEPLL